MRDVTTAAYGQGFSPVQPRPDDSKRLNSAILRSLILPASGTGSHL